MTNIVGRLESFTDSMGRTKWLKHRFHRESRLRYRVTDFGELEQDNFKLLKRFIKHHEQVQKPRLQELHDYGHGLNHGISESDYRRNEKDMSDARAIHDFGGMISVFKQGYLAGVPVRVDYSGDGDFSDIEVDNDFHSLNRDLVLDISQMGRAYDVVYRGQDDQTKVRKLDPMETFVIYDTSLSNHSVCAVRYYPQSQFSTSKKRLVELYTETNVRRFELSGNVLTEIGEADVNPFGKVQVTEYLNDEMGMGDYETILNLIDLYDASQSDTANYMNDLSDAILAVFGNLDFPEDMTVEQQQEMMRSMRQVRLMLFKPPRDNDGKEAGTVDAKYLTKNYDVSGVEAFKSRIEADIHKFTNMPNMTDSNFAGTQSGEAMKYKLFGLDQERVTTQALFEKSLRRRYELIATIGEVVHENGKFDDSKLKITFTPNLPKSLTEIIANFKALGGMVSNETAMELTNIVDDVEAEIEKLEGARPDSYDGLGGDVNVQTE